VHALLTKNVLYVGLQTLSNVQEGVLLQQVTGTVTYKTVYMNSS
jgi:hypothetical protein